jgi:Tfp pilus assembly protein PilF
MISQGNYRLAEAALRGVIAEDPTLVEARLILGDLHQARGEREDAVVQWQAALDAEDVPEWVETRAEQLQKGL